MAPAQKHPLLLRDCEHCRSPISAAYITKRGYERGRDGGIRFCSTACANKARPAKIWFDKHGYPQATIKGRSMAMHRHVMEKRLGRRLLPSETVHHKDGNRLNYADENLELWASRHGRGQRVSDLPHGAHEYFYQAPGLMSFGT